MHKSFALVLIFASLAIAEQGSVRLPADICRALWLEAPGMWQVTDAQADAVWHFLPSLLEECPIPADASFASTIEGKRIAIFGDSTNVRLYSAVVALANSSSALLDPGKPRRDMSFSLGAASVLFYNTPYLETLLAGMIRVLGEAENVSRLPVDVVIVNVGLHDLRYNAKLGVELSLEERFAFVLEALISLARAHPRTLVIWRQFSRLWDPLLAARGIDTSRFGNANVTALNALASMTLTRPVLTWHVYDLTASDELRDACAPHDGLHVCDSVALAMASSLHGVLHFHRQLSPPTQDPGQILPATPASSLEPLSAGQLLAAALCLLVLGTYSLVQSYHATIQVIRLHPALAALWDLHPPQAVSARDEDDEHGRRTPELLSKHGRAEPGGTFGALLTPESLGTLRQLAILALILIYLFLADGDPSSRLWPSEARSYARDTFLFINLAIWAASALTVQKDTGRPVGGACSRAQTEEWKGWMQVAFVLYHYFAAKEAYNTIRLFIAAYVWMTGFGNFSYFYVKKDFSFVRLFKMFFRLNFLVALLCLALRRPYMLYYVCSLHSFAFLSVYFVMWFGHQRNEDHAFMVSKLGLYGLAVVALYHLPHLFDLFFWPFGFLLKLDDSMHEWYFRSNLDKFMPLLGMICAYAHPRFMTWLAALDEHRASFRLKLVLGLGLLTVLATYARVLLVNVDKYYYNSWHPFVSFIPILAFLALRNLTPTLRTHSMWLFAWLGRITLETYLLQFHAWLCADAKMLTVYIGNNSRLLNFSLASAIFIVLSYQLFNVTTHLSDALAPNGISATGLLSRLGKLAALLFGGYAVCWLATQLHMTAPI